ncbi:SDR family oxidoreductase [Patulibacter minatonensis]|uniref:SDR family oxidoreductase n=1 Tax=Patulibacter minatonensis TaxID=298163 RepID=UPI0004B3F4E7|nr:SDR family oxidoreductase [Patulibacter minatonensis]
MFDPTSPTGRTEESDTGGAARIVDPVVVTGCASGIGAAVAALLVARGIPVIGLDLRAVGPDGVDLRACDLSDPAAIDDAVARLPGRIAGIASVAGVPGTHPAERIVAVNLLAPRRLGAALLPRIAPGGAIVNVASVAAQRSDRTDEDVAAVLDATDEDVPALVAAHGLDGTATYDFTKKALLALTRRQARAGVARGVRALSVSPGPTETPILGDFEETMGADRMAAAVAIVGRHGRPGDNAPLIAFLLSQEATWINAVDIPVDGGLLGIRD